MSPVLAFSERLERLEGGWQGLPDKPEETAERTLRALWFVAAGDARSLARVDGDLPLLSEAQQESLDRLIERRVAGEPLAHLSGRQAFLGLELLASPDALIPRVETELLASCAIDVARELVAHGVTPRVLDLCTGSGNVALAIAHHVSEARVFAADLSEAAVRLARQNARELSLDGRVQFEAGDLMSPFDGPEWAASFDIVTCNPPYISSGKVEQMPLEISAHEPRLAFDGGAFGFDVLTRLIAGAPKLLCATGVLCVEVGLGQGRFIAERIRRTGSFSSVELRKNDVGADRVVIARAGGGA